MRNVTHIKRNAIYQRTCFNCYKSFPESPENGTSGYAILSAGTFAGIRICYECAAVHELGRMLINGKATLYLVHDYNNKWHVGDWTSKLQFFVFEIRKSKHACFGGFQSRYDVWFDFLGYQWHGVQRGDNNTICRVSRTKKRSRNFVMQAF